MKHNWTYRPFLECIENVKYTTKLQTKDFAQQGTYPIISQDESYISGYWDNANDVFHAKRPLVIFGDHTRVLKYIDFDFVLGADGVKILLPTEDILAKYMYYYLKWYNVPSLGYSRHFKLLRDIEFPIPSLDEQQAIVCELDGINRLIDLQEEQLREYDRLAQSLFYTTFGDPVSNPKGWELKKLGEVAEKLFAGGDVPKNDLSQERDESHPYPIFSNGVVQDGLYGYTSCARVVEPALTITARGTIGVVFKRSEPFFPVVRLLVLVPKKEVLGMDYTMYCLRTFNIENNG